VRSRLRFMILVTIGTLAATVMGMTSAGAQLPSGERQLGKTIIEPGYDDRTGELIYIMTPEGAPFPSHTDAHSVSPLFIVMYPSSAAASVGTMNCAHEGGDNCADHGPVFADLAQSVVPTVYGNGVWGHDHIMDGPGGSEFNVTWQIVVVLFTNAAAANTHITTESQLDAAIEAGDAFTVETPTIFHCNLVSASTYNRATPLPPAAP
jgi:hypothetical protein